MKNPAQLPHFLRTFLSLRRIRKFANPVFSK
jgi:hypothetical protein